MLIIYIDYLIDLFDNYFNTITFKITKAADCRFITRQGLSKSLRELENELGVTLFGRGWHGVELTEYGKVFEKAARTWTSQHDYILETIKTMKAKSGSRPLCYVCL